MKALAEPAMCIHLGLADYESQNEGELIDNVLSFSLTDAYE